MAVVSSRAPWLLLRLLLVRARRRRGFLAVDLGGILQLRPRRQAVDLDDAGIADRGLHAEGLAHRAGDDLQLLLVLGGERDQHHEEGDQQAHQVGEGDEPAVTAAAVACCFLFAMSRPPRVRRRSGRRRRRCFVILGLGVPMVLRQIGEQHFAHQRRALGVADHQHAVEDQRAVGLFVVQLQLQLVGDRQTEQVGDAPRRRMWRAARPPCRDRAWKGRSCWRTSAPCRSACRPCRRPARSRRSRDRSSGPRRDG